MLEQSQAAVLVTDSANISLARELPPLPLFNVDEVIGDADTTDPGLRLAPSSHASIEYTSGSTGEPKGITVGGHGGGG